MLRSMSETRIEVPGQAEKPRISTTPYQPTRVGLFFSCVEHEILISQRLPLPNRNSPETWTPNIDAVRTTIKFDIATKLCIYGA